MPTVPPSTARSSAQPWLGRYLHPLPLRTRGAFHLYTCREPGAGPRLVVVGAPGTDPAQVGARLDAVARAHALVDSPHVPPVVGRGRHGDVEFLALACDAAVDFEEMTERFASATERREGLPYAQAMALPLALASALGAAHAARDPDTGQPLCFGALSLANVIVERSGKLSVLGLGHNFVLWREDGSAAGVPGPFLASEIAAGGRPSPGADIYAMFLLVNACIPHVAMPPALERIWRGEAGLEDLPLVEALQWVVTHLLGAAPGQRLDSIQEAMRQYARVWEHLGIRPDPDGFAATMRRLLQRTSARRVPAEEAAPAGELVVARSGAWYRTPDGATFAIERRAPLCRLLRALVAQRLERPGTPLTLAALVAHGWPGEDPLPEAGANRVYVALSSLRRLGLRDVLVRWEDGWLLDPRVPTRTSQEDEALGAHTLAEGQGAARRVASA